MKRIWVVAIAAAVVCGGIHLGNADTSDIMKTKGDKLPSNTKSIKIDHPDPSKLIRPPSVNNLNDKLMSIHEAQKQQQFCEAAKMVLSSTKSQPALDAFLTSIGSQCDGFIPCFTSKVKEANYAYNDIKKSIAVCGSSIKPISDKMDGGEVKSSDKSPLQGTPTVTPPVDPSKLIRPPATVTNSTGVQGLLIEAALKKQKQKEYCEAAQTVLSTTTSVEGFSKLLDEIGPNCDAFIRDFGCKVKKANSEVWSKSRNGLPSADCRTTSTFTD